MKPQRIQLKRTKGWRIPENTIKVDRSTRYGNPWSVKETLEKNLFVPSEVPRVCVECFRAWLSDKGTQYEKFPLYEKLKDRRQVILDSLPELKGKNLACWCSGEFCHADVLLELANKESWLCT